MGIRILAYRPVNSDLALRLTAFDGSVYAFYRPAITGFHPTSKKSAKLAGINRHVSSHACRHSFASHLFESGTDIKYIQSLLGHVDPRSTDVYLHVSNKTLLGIHSPFDNPEGGES